ncbi:hypothetical protein YC2023_078795 [Brassica napus]
MERTTWFDNDGLKKGKWSAEEDRILVAYINEYGLGDWRTLPKRAGINIYLHPIHMHTLRTDHLGFCSFIRVNWDCIAGLVLNRVFKPVLCNI